MRSRSSAPSVAVGARLRPEDPRVAPLPAHLAAQVAEVRHAQLHEGRHRQVVRRAARRGAPSRRGGPGHAARGGAGRNPRAAARGESSWTAVTGCRGRSRARSRAGRRRRSGTSSRVNMMQSSCGPVVALRLVDRALEGADLARSTGRSPSSFVSSTCSSRKSASISSSGRVRGADLAALRLELARASSRTPPSPTASAAACRASTRSFHFRFAGSSSAVTFGSQGSTRSAARLVGHGGGVVLVGERRRSGGRTRGRRRTAPRGCRRRPCEYRPKIPPPP